MIDIKQLVFLLGFIYIFEPSDNNDARGLKSLENRCIEEDVFLCILRSNLKLNSTLVNRLDVLRFALTTVRAVRNVVVLAW